MDLSIRVMLQTPAGAYCSFTVSNVLFVYPPVRGDFIVLNFKEGEDYAAKVSNSVHYCTEPPATLVHTEPFRCESYDSMLLMLDKFKASYPLESFDSSDQEPETYYSFYRSVLKLMGLESMDSPTLVVVPSDIKIFAESCRSILLGELFRNGISNEREFDKAFSTYNPIIEELHRIVLTKKLDATEVSILEIIKDWEPLVNQNKKIKWDADFDSYVRVAHMVFSRINSLGFDQYPEILR